MLAGALTQPGMAQLQSQLSLEGSAAWSSPARYSPHPILDLICASGCWGTPAQLIQNSDEYCSSAWSGLPPNVAPVLPSRSSGLAGEFPKFPYQACFPYWILVKCALFGNDLLSVPASACVSGYCSLLLPSLFPAQLLQVSDGLLLSSVIHLSSFLWNSGCSSPTETCP